MASVAIKNRGAWEQVRALFDRLVEEPPAEREVQFARLRLPDAVLRETRELLAAADAASGFMALLTAPEPTVPNYSSLPIGSLVGAFKITAVVGRGGHGEVYDAARHGGQFEQRVALKLLRPEALAQFDRFRAERQILAGLEHPGISRLIDGGIAPDGRPYMAMEFVEGQTIDHHCRDQQLDTAAVLGLMIEVSSAIAYAHANLVVHGDIKPDNVLVTASGQPKLIDFGVAQLLDTNRITSGLTVALSTPAYAAPEQLAGLRATIATDIYALGALLYELLAGRAPWHGSDAPLSWAARILDDEPPLPSAVARSAGPITATQLRGDLDAIVAKAMRGAANARYETVPAFIDDLRRVLGQRPVSARKGTTLYRVSRFVRRNAVAVGASVIILLTLSVGTTGIAWNMKRAEANRAAAQLETVRGEAMRDFLAVLFRATYETGEEGLRNPREILDATAAQIERDAAVGPVNAQLVRTIGELYFEVEEFTAAEPILADFLRLADTQGESNLQAPVKRLLAAIALRQGDLVHAGALIADARALLAAAGAVNTRESAELDGLEAALLRERGERDAGIALLRSAVTQLTGLLGPTSLDTLMLRQNLAVHLIGTGDLDTASTMLDDIMRTLDTTGRRFSAIALAATSAQAVIASQNGDMEQAADLASEAVAIRRQTYPPSASLSALQLNEARALASIGRNDEALAIFDEAIALSASMGLEGGSTHALLVSNRGLSRLTRGDTEGAAADIEAGLVMAEANFGRESQYFGAGLFGRAQLRFVQGNLPGARTDLAAARKIFEAIGPGGASVLSMIDQVQTILDESSGS